MPQIRPALAALLAASAALIVLLLACAPASAEDLGSKLEDKEAKLSDVREREGVLTTTISHYRDRIERLTDEVAVLRGQEAAVKQRLDAKQAELDAAVAELDVAKKHLEVVRGRLQRALVALRERLVAIYENGTPDVLSVIVRADGYDELIAQPEYLERIHGMDEAVVERVRQLRDQVQGTVSRLRSAKLRIESARDAIAAERAGPGRRPLSGAAAPVEAGRSAARPRGRCFRRSTTTSRRSRARSPKSRPKSRPSSGLPPPRRCRRARSGTARAS